MTIKQALPEKVLESWKILSCLQATEKTETYLCISKTDDTRIILKITRDAQSACQFWNEDEMLHRIEQACSSASSSVPGALARMHPGFCMNLDGQTIFARSYIEGRPLDEIVFSQVDKPGIPLEKAVWYLDHILCQIEFLHNMHPPVIHRDIKPQNVIVDTQGEAHLIDFGIARFHRGDSTHDTTVLGSHLTAPPEQFGYRQTDERSDIYSAGILLRYCLTGEYGDSADTEIPQKVLRVIEKATAFDPDQRYQCAADMRRDLSSLNLPHADPSQERAGQHPEEDKPRKGFIGRHLPLCISLILLILLVASFFFLGPGASPSLQVDEPEAIETAAHSVPYTFKEPLIEQAVRQTLDRPDGYITEKDLEFVTSLFIFGRQIYTSDDQIWFLGNDVYMRLDDMREQQLWKENGGITSLEDIRHMPNIHELSLYRQNISSLEELQGCPIRRLGIGYNPLTDLAPLSSLDLIALNISCLNISDLTCLQGQEHLEELHVADMPLRSLDPLTNLPLRILNLYNITCPMEPLREMPTLEALTLGKMNRYLFDILKDTQIQDLEVTHAEGVPFLSLQALPRLRRLYFYADTYEEIPSGVWNFPSLRWLDLKNVGMESFHCLSAMQSLESLFIYACDVQDFHGLEELPNLKKIDCTPDQKDALESLYPDHAWAMN
ncbi:MAG: protein kinase [Clostridia bacterium]|nr:protein kinase [Clostridia bacterium]